MRARHHLRKALGEEGVEALLQQTINVAVTLKLITKAALSTVIVDSTIQHKAVAYPTDSKMLEAARSKLVEAAKGQGIELKQTFAKEGSDLASRAGRYAHAKQHKRMRRTSWLLRTIARKGLRALLRLLPTGLATELMRLMAAPSIVSMHAAPSNARLVG